MLNQIKSVFSNLEETPLFYVESGSRLWGIASPDSDYDVRGFHIQSKKQYFDFKPYRGVIEVMDGDFDFVSYDVDKMFGLLVKSNPTVFEWIRANIVYFNELPDWNNFQTELIMNFDFKALYFHYLSLSKEHIKLMETDRYFTYKTVFYCIRGLLSAELSSKHIIPELLIDNLFKQFETETEVLTIAKNSLERKKQKTEKEEVREKEREGILKAIRQNKLVLESKVPDSSNSKIKLENLLSNYSYHLKSQYYK